MSNRFLRVAGLTLGVLLLLSSGVKADNYETTFSLTNDAEVYTNYTNPATLTVTTSPEQTWAVPFTMTDTNPLNPISFTAFCIDLYHNVSNGQTTTNNPGFVNVEGAKGYLATTAGTTGNQNFPNYSAYTTDLDNRLNYLGAVFNQLQQSAYKGDTYLLGAVQLAGR